MFAENTCKHYSVGQCHAKVQPFYDDYLTDTNGTFTEGRERCFIHLAEALRTTTYRRIQEHKFGL